MTFNHITSEFKLHYKIYESCTSNLTEVCSYVKPFYFHVWAKVEHIHRVGQLDHIYPGQVGLTLFIN